MLISERGEAGEGASCLVETLRRDRHQAAEDEARRAFTGLAALRDQHGGAARLPELSMGMSDDLEVAVASGATMVRIGTAIFGAR